MMRCYRVPGLGYNAETGQTKLITYHAYGVGCSEVEIDCLTGDHQVTAEFVVACTQEKKVIDSTNTNLELMNTEIKTTDKGVKCTQT